MTVTPNLVPSKSCPVWVYIEYKLYTVEASGLGLIGLGFSIDEAIGGQLRAGDHSRHYMRTSMESCMASKNLYIAVMRAGECEGVCM